MSKFLTFLVAAGSIAAAAAVTASPAKAQWGGDYYPSYGYGYAPAVSGYGYGAIPAVPVAPYAIVAVPAVPSVVAVPTVPPYGYGAAVAAPSYGYGYGAAVAAPSYGYGYASTGYWPYRNLYSYAPGYYARRWYWQ